MESFAIGLKRIYTACKEAGGRVEFEQQAYGFAVIFYRDGRNNMWGTPQVTPQVTPQDERKSEVVEKILSYIDTLKVSDSLEQNEIDMIIHILAGERNISEMR